MKRGGIFTGLGDLGGQTLALRTINSAGQTTANPFAAAVQTVLRQQQGADNLTVDGKWGDCSQQAYMSAMGAKPNPSDLNHFMRLFYFGSPTVKVWDKTPHCPSPEGEVTGAFNDKIQPALILAKMLNLPVPDGICDTGMSPNLETGACERKVSSTLRYALKATTPSVRDVRAVSPIYNFTQTQPTTIASKISNLLRTSFSPAPPSGAQAVMPGGSPPPGSAPLVGGTGMSGGAKLAVAAVAVAAIAGGVVLWKRSKSAVPNCGFYPNCGE